MCVWTWMHVCHGVSEEARWQSAGNHLSFYHTSPRNQTRALRLRLISTHWTMSPSLVPLLSRGWFPALDSSKVFTYLAHKWSLVNIFWEWDIMGTSYWPLLRNGVRASHPESSAIKMVLVLCSSGKSNVESELNPESPGKGFRNHWYPQTLNKLGWHAVGPSEIIKNPLSDCEEPAG